jgi:hypothetical protein
LPEAELLKPVSDDLLHRGSAPNQAGFVRPRWQLYTFLKSLADRRLAAHPRARTDSRTLKSSALRAGGSN